MIYPDPAAAESPTISNESFCLFLFDLHVHPLVLEVLSYFFDTVTLNYERIKAIVAALSNIMD